MDEKADREGGEKMATLYGLISKLYHRARKSGEFDPDGAIWIVITALRGPDEDIGMDKALNIELSTELKLYSTCRLRAIFGMDTEAPAAVNYRPLDELEIVRRNILLRKTSFHFRSHFIAAMRLLYQLGYPVPEKEMDFDTTEQKEYYVEYRKELENSMVMGARRMKWR